MASTSNGLRSLAEVARYRGHFGQLDWILRRLAGLGVVLFLLIHIADTATVYFAPAAYAFFVALYKNPLYGLGEVALAGGVIYHAMSGLVIIILDFWPALWQWRARASLIVWALFLLLFVPIGSVMLVRIVEHSLSR
jgi:succinate dehydrogenase / fumarate reductase cytochrome b subunit